MKNNWEVKKLAEVCEVFADGDWIESKDQSPDGIRLIQTGNVGNGFFKDRGEKARYISESTFKRLRCSEIFEADCLISRLPDPVGRACILPDTGERMITAVDCTIVRFDSEKIIPEFFNYYAQSHKYLNDVEHETTGTTRKRISRKSLGLISIPIPPLAEQQRIVAILDEAFAAIAQAKENAEKNLQNARELFDSYLQSVFANPGDGWEVKTLGEVCDLISGQHIDSKDYNSEGKGIGYLTGPSDFGSLNPLVSKWTEHPKVKAKNGDILITVKGSGVGKINLLHLDEVVISRQIMAARIKNAETSFIYAFLGLQYNYFQSLGNGAAIPGISRHNVLDLKCPIPSLSEQRSIVAKFNALSVETKKLENIYRQKINDLDELKKSILQKAFNGEL